MNQLSPKVSLIFPVYGQSKLLLTALETLREVTEYPDYEVIIVDDCSMEDMEAVYEKRYLYDKLIRLPYNLGNSTRVVNEGVKAASGKFIQYQNSDVYFEFPKWLHIIIESFSDDTGVVGPALTYPNKTIQSAGMYFDKRGLNRHLFRYRLYGTIKKRTLEVPMVTGCGLTTRRDVYDELNGFRAYEPYGWDDTDWCLRVREKGFKVKVCLGSYFYHFGTVSYRGKDNPKYHKNRKVIYRRFKEIINLDKNFRSVGKKYIIFTKNLNHNSRNVRLLQHIRKLLDASNREAQVLLVPRSYGEMKDLFQREGVRIFPESFGKQRNIYNVYSFIDAERPDVVVYDRGYGLLFFCFTIFLRAYHVGDGQYIEMRRFIDTDNDSKKILFLGHNLKNQGAPMSLFYLAKCFSKRRYDINVVGMDGGALAKRYEREGICPLIWSRPVGNFSCLMFLIRKSWFFYKNHYDIIYVNTITLYYLLFLPTLNKSKCILCIRESERDYYFKTFNKGPFINIQRALRKVKTVLFVSETTRKVYEDLNVKKNFEVIYNGIDIEEIEDYKKQNSRDDIKKEFGLETTKVFVNVGTIVERKGQKYLVEAAIKFIRSGKDRDVCFFLVGGNGSAYEKEIGEMINENNINAKIIIVPETRDVFKYYRLADCFVFTSIFESFPRVILEAMAFEVAIISTNCFGVSEQIEDGKSGLFVKSCDSDDLFKKLQFIDQNPGVAKRLEKEAHRRVMRQFSMEVMIRKYEKLFDKFKKGYQGN